MPGDMIRRILIASSGKHISYSQGPLDIFPLKAVGKVIPCLLCPSTKATTSQLLYCSLSMAWILNASREVEAKSQYPTIVAIYMVLTIISVASISPRLSGTSAEAWPAIIYNLPLVVFALIYAMLLYCLYVVDSFHPLLFLPLDGYERI